MRNVTARIEPARPTVVMPVAKRYKSAEELGKYDMLRSFPLGAMLLVWSNVLLAQERPLIEEIIVTAQRIEENASKVPMSISAFTDAAIRDRQLVGLVDLHITVPNLS